MPSPFDSCPSLDTGSRVRQGSRAGVVLWMETWLAPAYGKGGIAPQLPCAVWL